MIDIIGPYQGDRVDERELHDPVTGEFWTMERQRDEWRFVGPGRKPSAYYTKGEAIARCKEAMLAARGEPAAAKPEPKPGERPTADEQRYMDRVRALGCAVEDEHCAGPIEVHHVRLVPGQRRIHRQTVGLCSAHHRTGGHGIAFHAGQEAWQERYGPIADLVEIVRYAVAETALQEAGR